MKIKVVSSFVLLPFYWFCLCHLIIVVSGQCLDDQKSLLLQFKNNLTFIPSDSSLYLWNASHDCCNWKAVSCDDEGHVISLFLFENIISAAIDDSSALFSLQHLDDLRLEGLYFDGALPRSIGKLRNLSVLHLSDCGFNGTIPNSLSNLTELSELYLSNNKFTGPIPSLGVHKNLTKLDLSNNSLNGIIPFSHFEGMHNLEYVDLSYNSFNGSIPASLLTLPSLRHIDLSNNRFNQLDKFIDVSSSVLDTLNLGSNNLSGPFPTFIFQLSKLSSLKLSSNKFDGSVQLNKLFSELKNLSELHLSYNSFFVDTNIAPSTVSKISDLYLVSCNLKTFPTFLEYLPSLVSVDISDNQIQGIVPNWIWNKDFSLNISHNLLTELEGPLNDISIALEILDIHHNKLQGSIPDFFLDEAIYLIFLDYSNNTLHGPIPDSLCNAFYLQVLDLSMNNISGRIPSCLMRMSGTLGVLNLKNNNLSGPIPDTVPTFCSLWTLNLHGNQLDGSIPKSLVHCSELEVLDLGSNQMISGFPCFLKEISTLRVLILRNNKFQGSLRCLNANKTWEMLQIVDIAFNNFSGKLSGKYFITWNRNVTGNEDEAKSDIIREEFYLDKLFYYQDGVTVIIKGQQMELVKILTIFTSIDFSSNHFEGPIPMDLMDFKTLYGLNLSNNALSGEIPSSIGNLKQLESLDLSQNLLSGEIPMELASLSFLSYLNLSFNHLEGKIPTGTQIQSFSASSFEGNAKLYGSPLTENDDENVSRVLPSHEECGRLACTVDWNFISVELGLVFGHGIVFGPLLIWKQWRVWYWQLIHKVLCWIFPQMYIEYATQRGQTYATLRWWHH